MLTKSDIFAVVELQSYESGFVVIYWLGDAYA